MALTRGFWERQRSVFFDVRVYHPNADSYRDLTSKQIYKKHENEKKRQYAEIVMQIELTTPENTITYHNALCLSPQNLV